MRELEILFLGTGTSHGVPVIGCDCPVCRSEDPRDKRLRTSIQVTTPEMVIQVDTTPDFRTQCLREDIRRIDAVIYTHSHTDHILGFDDLRRFCEMTDREMPVYASPRTMEDLRRVFQYAFGGQYAYRNYIRPDPHVVEAPFSLGETEIVPVNLPHGRMDTMGLIFKRGGRKLLAYFTDCQDVPEPVIAEATGVEVLVLDALRHTAHSTHMTVQQALAVAARIVPGKTFFTHMCHDLGHAETESSLPPEVRLAYDGLKVFI